MKAPTEILSCDVLVIGGGGAGCRAAIEAARCGNSVILVNKFPPIGRSGTTITAMITYTGTMGQLGICPDDGPDVLFWDVVRGRTPARQSGPYRSVLSRGQRYCTGT